MPGVRKRRRQEKRDRRVDRKRAEVRKEKMIKQRERDWFRIK